jgi:hypothetical protein
MQPWTYKGTPYMETPEQGLYSFVYIIENTKTQVKYIGKKLFWFKGFAKVLLKNGKKKKKRVLVESDWRTYLGSSDVLKKEIEQHGEGVFTRTILHLCKSKAEATYLEAHEQFSQKVLLSDHFHNGWIMVRVRKDHLVRNRDEILAKVT